MPGNDVVHFATASRSSVTVHNATAATFCAVYTTFLAKWIATEVNIYVNCNYTSTYIDQRLFLTSSL